MTIYEGTAEGMARLRRDFGPKEDPEEEQAKALPPLSPDLDLFDEGIGLSIRSCNACSELGVHTLRDLARLEERDVRRLRGVGRKTLAELRLTMARAGLHFFEPGSAAEARGLIIRLIQQGGGYLARDLVEEANAWLAKAPT